MRQRAFVEGALAVQTTSIASPDKTFSSLEVKIGLIEIAARETMRTRLMKSLLRKLIAFAVWAAAGQVFATSPISIPNYRVGDTARVDIIAPFTLVAVDPAKTAELKAKEAARVAAVFRWDTNGTARSIVEFRAQVAAEQVGFIEALLVEYKKASLDPKAVNQQRFRKLVVSLQDTNKPMLLTVPLAKTWATNGDDTLLIGEIERRFVEAAALCIRPDEWPVQWKNAYQFKVVQADGTTPITADMVYKSKLQFRRTNFFALGKLRSDFQKQFPRDQKAYAKFAAAFLTPNCFPEELLTQEMRAKRVQDVWSATEFKAGETIVRAGEVVTPLAKAALDELRVRMLAFKAQEPQPRSQWVIPSITAAVGLVLVCSIVVGWSMRRRRAAMLALEVTAPTGISGDPTVRAQTVERLTRLLGETLVKRLFVDRTRLLESQSQTAAQTEQLEQRSETIQTRVQEKYREYEERIARLEAELATAEEEKRDIIRAKIVLAREELEAERAKNRVDWN